MRKKFGPYRLSSQGQLKKLDKLLFRYILKDTNIIPTLEVFGTTHNGTTKVLCQAKAFRYTDCDNRGEVEWLVNFDYKKCISFYFYINDYQQISRLREVKAITNGYTILPTGTDGTSAGEVCDPPNRVTE